MTWPVISLFITAVNSPLGVSQREREREAGKKREVVRKRLIYSEWEHSQHQFVSHLITSFMVNHVLFEKDHVLFDHVLFEKDAAVWSDPTSLIWSNSCTVDVCTAAVTWCLPASFYTELLTPPFSGRSHLKWWIKIETYASCYFLPRCLLHRLTKNFSWSG